MSASRCYVATLRTTIEYQQARITVRGLVRDNSRATTGSRSYRMSNARSGILSGQG
ncbi:hypothetical protein TorRG33x02_338150, partial [Trema orientale]